MNPFIRSSYNTSDPEPPKSYDVGPMVARTPETTTARNAYEGNPTTLRTVTPTSSNGLWQTKSVPGTNVSNPNPDGMEDLSALQASCQAGDISACKAYARLRGQQKDVSETQNYATGGPVSRQAGPRPKMGRSMANTTRNNAAGPRPKMSARRPTPAPEQTQIGHTRGFENPWNSVRQLQEQEERMQRSFKNTPQNTSQNTFANGGMVRRYADGGMVEPMGGMMPPMPMPEANAGGDGAIPPSDSLLSQGSMESADMAGNVPPMDSEMAGFEMVMSSVGDQLEEADVAELQEAFSTYPVLDKVMTLLPMNFDGDVNGPGGGTSDDIPARLSDGEFVFTAKAAQQIGIDKLQKMMEDAEAKADGMATPMGNNFKCGGLVKRR